MAIITLVALALWYLGVVRALILGFRDAECGAMRPILRYTIWRVVCWPFAAVVDYWNENLREGW